MQLGEGGGRVESLHATETFLGLVFSESAAKMLLSVSRLETSTSVEMVYKVSCPSVPHIG